MGFNKKKRQFSQMHVVFADMIVLFVYITNFYLSLKGLQQISDLAITIVTVYGAFATGGYFTLCAFRDTSWNKHVEAKLHNHEGVEGSEGAGE